MYHFTADHPPEPVRLSFRALIPGHIRQYLKDFQIDAIRFMHNFWSKNEFCVYNDESGLGKQAAVVVLLDAACSSRKCLIVVQNDDRYVSGWEFHFNVLTKTNVSVIKDEKDTTDSPHNVYIAKWSSLRAIDDLSRFKFDFIILDNRGQMLNNSFCTSMLLKHYERKINLLISSVDITSDLKLLHNVLRLGGRLDPQYFSFKVFEEKFKLPDAKELAYKRVDLEEYFCKRERLADYCKAFRLRRYCHQFEKQLPLVKDDRYKINLELWREKQTATNSESSSIEFVNHQNREDKHLKDTQELFEEYCRQRRKEHLKFQQQDKQHLQQKQGVISKSLETEKEIIHSVDDEVNLINDSPPMTTDKSSTSRDNSDDPVLMSPLMVESDSDADDIPEICNDRTIDLEIVDLSSEEKDEENHRQIEDNVAVIENRKQHEESGKCSAGNKKVSKWKKRNELAKLEEDIVDALKIPKSFSRHRKEGYNSKPPSERLNKRLSLNRVSKSTSPNHKTPKSLKNTSNVNHSLKCQLKSPEKTTTPKQRKEKHSKENCEDSSRTLEIRTKQNFTTPTRAKNENVKKTSGSSSTKSTSNLCSVEENKKNQKGNNYSNETNITTTPLTSRQTRSMQNMDIMCKETPTIDKTNQVLIKQELMEETPQAKKVKSRALQAKSNSEKIHLKREMEISPVGVHLKQTRSMQRLTRSAVGSSKYLTKNLSLQIDKINKSKRKSTHKEKSQSSGTNEKKELNDDVKRADSNKNKKTIEDKTKNKNDIKNTQASVISHRSSQDYESLPCAQRLSDASVFDNDMGKANEFLIPSTPNAIARNSLIPSSLTSSIGAAIESEVIFIPPSHPKNATANRKHDQVISISSSDNENSTSQSSSTNVSMTSRRTRALKPKRNPQRAAGEPSKVPSFSDLLVQQNTRSSAKSPDLFSNCSDLIQIPCTQQNLDSEEPNTPFEGFKIFGSEVKQLQQHYAFNKNNKANKQHPDPKKSYREQRSCLDILEKMFEPSNKKPKQIFSDKSATPSKKSIRGVATENKLKTQTPILPSHPIDAIAEARQQQDQRKSNRSTSGLQDDDIFEITNNGTFGSVMRLHSNGDISPVQHTQKNNATQHNKITNYLIGNAAQNGSQEETTTNSGNSAGNINSEAGTPSKRHHQLAGVQNVNVKKSPKGKCNTTQTTKLTKWFTKPSELSNREIAIKSKALNSEKTPTNNQVHASQEVMDLTITAAPSPGKRILKRRRLDLSFTK